MKEKTKTYVLIYLIITLIISIIVLTILYIFKNKGNVDVENNNSKLYSTWEVYKTEVVRDNDVLYDMEVNNIYFNISINNSINICYQIDDEKKCDSSDYIHNNNILNITNDDSPYSGEYKITFDNYIIILEKIYDIITNTSIRHYFQRPLG
mgnify:FL=1